MLTSQFQCCFWENHGYSNPVEPTIPMLFVVVPGCLLFARQTTSVRKPWHKGCCPLRRVLLCYKGANQVSSGPEL